MRAARDDIDILSVILPHNWALQLRFFENSSDNPYLASIARNYTKLNMRYTYYMALHSYNLCTNNLFGDAVMPL